MKWARGFWLLVKYGGSERREAVVEGCGFGGVETREASARVCMCERGRRSGGCPRKYGECCSVVIRREDDDDLSIACIAGVENPLPLVGAADRSGEKLPCGIGTSGG